MSAHLVESTPAQLPAPNLATLERRIRLEEVISLVGLKRSSIMWGMKCGTFPKCEPIGSRIVAWRLSEVLAWVENPTPAPPRPLNGRPPVPDMGGAPA